MSSLVSPLQSLQRTNASAALFSSFEPVVCVSLKIKVSKTLRASRGLFSKVFLRQPHLTVVKAWQQNTWTVICRQTARWRGKDKMIERERGREREQLVVLFCVHGAFWAELCFVFLFELVQLFWEHTCLSWRAGMRFSLRDVLVCRAPPSQTRHLLTKFY